MVGVCFFTVVGVGVILLQPLHVLLCPLRYCQAEPWTKQGLCVLEGKVSVFKISECLNKY